MQVLPREASRGLLDSQHKTGLDWWVYVSVGAWQLDLFVGRFRWLGLPGKVCRDACHVPFRPLVDAVLQARARRGAGFRGHRQTGMARLAGNWVSFAD